MKQPLSTDEALRVVETGVAPERTFEAAVTLASEVHRLREAAHLRVIEMDSLRSQLELYRSAIDAAENAFDLMNADTVNIANPHDREAVAYFDAKANGAAYVRRAYRQALGDPW